MNEELNQKTQMIFNNNNNSNNLNSVNNSSSDLNTKNQSSTKDKQPSSFGCNSDFIRFKSTEIKPEEELRNPSMIKFNYKAPWLTEETKKHSGIIRLHYEILDFYNFMKPTEKEDQLRIQTIKEFKDLVQSNLKDVQVKTFGSFPNRLHLPDSDIDVVVFSPPSSENEFSKEQKILEKIATILINNNAVDYIRKIDARVPILKIKMKSTGIYMDIW